MAIPKYTVIQYLRNKKRVPYGVLVAVKDESNKYSFGYSVCSKEDSFSKDRALNIAIGRATEKSADCAESLPHAVRKAAPAFFDRCKRYYK